MKSFLRWFSICVITPIALVIGVIMTLVFYAIVITVFVFMFNMFILLLK